MGTWKRVGVFVTLVWAASTVAVSAGGPKEETFSAAISYEQAWSIAIATIADVGFGITSQDKASGLIAAENRDTSLFGNDTSHLLQIRLSKTPAGVQVTAVAQRKGNGQLWGEKTHRKFKEKFLARVISGNLGSASSVPKTIKLGQTEAEVTELMGQPKRIVDLGSKKTYLYDDIRVVFTSGKVSDVQ